MLGEKQWYTEPDDSTESWVLLVVETETESEGVYPSAWHVGLANTQEITSYESMEIRSPPQETELLRSLLNELEPHRYSDLTVVTPSQQTIRWLRTRLFLSPIESASLRGFNHLSIAELLEHCFTVHVELPAKLSRANQRSADSPLASTCSLEELEIAEHQTAVEQLWALLTQLGPLVPRQLLSGSSL